MKRVYMQMLLTILAILVLQIATFIHWCINGVHEDCIFTWGALLSTIAIIWAIGQFYLHTHKREK